jgi:hypothetical protein
MHIRQSIPHRIMSDTLSAAEPATMTQMTTININISFI